MAAITPTSIIRTTFGDLTVHFARFAGTADTADTWASGIPGIVFHQLTINDDVTTQASIGGGATVSGSTFTIALGEDNTAFDLAVYSRS